MNDVCHAGDCSLMSWRRWKILILEVTGSTDLKETSGWESRYLLDYVRLCFDTSKHDRRTDSKVR